MTKMFYSTPLPEAKHEAAEKSDVAALRQYAIDAMNSIDKKKEKEKEQLKILHNAALISHEDFLEMTTDGNIKVIDTRNMTTEEKDKLMRKIRIVPQIAYDLLQGLDN